MSTLHLRARFCDLEVTSITCDLDELAVLIERQLRRPWSRDRDA